MREPGRSQGGSPGWSWGKGGEILEDLSRPASPLLDEKSSRTGPCPEEGFAAISLQILSPL